MPFSLRIPPEKARLIREAAERDGLTQTAFIMEAVDRKLGVSPGRALIIKSLAGWLDQAEGVELEAHLAVFEQIQPGDWP